MNDEQYVDPDRDRVRAHDEANQAFESNSVWTASDEELKRYIFGSSGPIGNTNMQSTEVVRALTINHIQMSRVIERLNTRSDFLAKQVFWLTVIAVVAAVIQVAIALIALFCLVPEFRCLLNQLKNPEQPHFSAVVYVCQSTETRFVHRHRTGEFKR